MRKTGIIYCPKHAGLKPAKKRWDNIAETLAKYGIEYDLVQSEGQDSVSRIATTMIHNGYEDIIIVGGDTALLDVCNCLMHEEKSAREKVNIGVIPNGLMNDFAKFWGFQEKDLEGVVSSLKEHRTRKVDVGIMTYYDKEDEQKTMYFLNCINIGLVASIQRLRQQTRKVFWSRKLSYVISLILLIFIRKDFRVHYTINYVKEKRNIMSMCIGNALGYGLTPNAVPYNGMTDITVLMNSKLTELFSGISLFLRGKILNAKDAFPYRCREVNVEVAKNTPISIDGQPISISYHRPNINVKVEQEAINFIIEK